MADEEVVIDRLELINQYTNECKEMRDVSRTEYLDDFVLQRAVERSLVNCLGVKPRGLSVDSRSNCVVQ